MTLRKPGSATAPYSATHPQFRGLSNWARSCGKCRQHFESAKGQKRHPVLGMLCTTCSGGGKA
jgi:hypothetical protein